MVYITGDLHGGVTASHISSAHFRQAGAGDIVIVCGDLGGVWWHDYHTNAKHKREENYFLNSVLRKKITWLAVDGNHENFARLFGGEFPLVETFGGRAYQVREHVYYLKRGDLFTINGSTFLAFGGASSHDKEAGWQSRGYDEKRVWYKGRTEGIDWWPEEVPSQDDICNAYHNLDQSDWRVDHVISHACPLNLREHFVKNSRSQDPTELILQDIYDKIQFKSWHFGHYHNEKRYEKLSCHYDQVQLVADL